jgi:hypothetical protein
MTESRELTLTVPALLEELIVERAFEAGAAGPYDARIRNALAAALKIAESDPHGTREALWRLRRDRPTLERLERCLGGDPRRATLAIGAVIQIAHEELSSPQPNLSARAPELLRWLEGAW